MATTAEIELDKGISEIVGALTDPIIVWPGGWGDTLPDWLKTQITLERIIENARSLAGGEMTGTDAEACAYIMTASLTFPLDHDWTQIYLYVANQTVKRHRGEQTDIPVDIRVDMLTTEQMRDLARLKAWIYRRRSDHRLGKDRAERREHREAEKEKRKKEEEAQPKLFEF